MDSSVWGFIGVVAGVVLTEVSALVRGRQGDRSAQRAEESQRRTQLWELSRPVAGQLQDDFLRLQLSTRSFDYEPPQYPGFDERFDESWEKREDGYRKNISLIPDPAYRHGLGVVCDAITINYSLARHAKFARDGEAVVNQVAALGVEITASWLRGETRLEQATTERVVGTENAITRARAALQEERNDLAENSSDD